MSEQVMGYEAVWDSQKQKLVQGPPIIGKLDYSRMATDQAGLLTRAIPNVEGSVKMEPPIKREYETFDSGQRELFKSGAVRDTQEGKPRFDLIPPLALKRLADLYARGAKKYDEWNWSKVGENPGEGMGFARIYSSGLRHLMQFGMGDDSEDHLSAVAFAVFSIMHFQEMGRTDLDDMPKWKSKMKNENPPQTN